MKEHGTTIFPGETVYLSGPESFRSLRGFCFPVIISVFKINGSRKMQMIIFFYPAAPEIFFSVGKSFHRNDTTVFILQCSYFYKQSDGKSISHRQFIRPHTAAVLCDMKGRKMIGSQDPVFPCPCGSKTETPQKDMAVNRIIRMQIG